MPRVKIRRKHLPMDCKKQINLRGQISASFIAAYQIVAGKLAPPINPHKGKISERGGIFRCLNKKYTPMVQSKIAIPYSALLFATAFLIFLYPYFFDSVCFNGKTVLELLCIYIKLTEGCKSMSSKIKSAACHTLPYARVFS